MKLHWHQILISLLIGILAGYGAAQWKTCQMRDHWKKGNMKQMIVAKLDKELGLTSDQKKQITAIFEAQHPRMIAIHEEMRPKFESIKQKTQEDIRKVLTPEQQPKFDALNAKWEQRMKERREAWMQ